MATRGPSMRPGAANTFIPDHEATNYLMTQYSRNVKDFPLNRYVQYADITKEKGFYLEMTAEQAARLKGGSVDMYHWPDAGDRPRSHDATEKFNWVDYVAQRYDFDCLLGWLSRDQAGFDLQDVELANKAQLAMTARTKRIHGVLQTASYWDSDHIKDVTTITGNAGTWAQSTTVRSDIKRSINYGIDQIRKKTLGVVQDKKDMILLVNPKTAQKIGESQEMIGAFIQSPHALAQWEGQNPKYNNWGLPDELFGIEIVVENTVMVTSNREAATTTYSDVMADGVAYLLSRPGGLVAKSSSGPNFSSIMQFLYEDMTVETLDDTNNRRTELHIVDHTAEELVAPAASFQFTNVA